MWACSCLASCCASCACGLCTSAAAEVSRRSARIAYCGLFGLSLVVSWILREVGAPLLEKIPCTGLIILMLLHLMNGLKQMLFFELVWEIFFFTIFSLMMIGVKDQNDKRHLLHHGGWTVKFLSWTVLVILMFFLPNSVISIYESLCRFGSGLFLLIQVILLLDFTHKWNDAWVEKDEPKWYIALLSVTVVCYLAACAFSGVLFIWFNPSGHSCSLNIFFIVMTMILGFVIAIMSMHPKVNGSLLPASVIAVYCAFLCYSGLSSEPRDYECNGLNNHSTVVSTGTLVLGMLATVLSVLYSAVRAGSSTTFLSPPSSPKSGSMPLLGGQDTEKGKSDKDVKDAKPVSYSYSFFHLVFALASMYAAMLLTGWSSSTLNNTQLIDVGWISVWVRICTEWATAALYVWTLVAPLVMPDREFF